MALLGALDTEAITAAGGKGAEAVALLALVAGQDVEPAPGSDGTDGRWRIARQVAPDRVISTVDPEARHAHKTVERRQDGDANVGIGLLGADPTIDDGAPVQVLGDSAYGTGDMLATLDATGLTPVIKPWPVRPAALGGFTIDDFTHDPHRAVHVLSARPQGAGARARPAPTRAPSPRRRPSFRTVYRTHRPMVERTIAWLTQGNRRAPFRGVTKNNAWLHHRVAALNLVRLLALGLDVQIGSWALTWARDPGPTAPQWAPSGTPASTPVTTD